VSRPLQSRRKVPEAIALSLPLIITEGQIGEMIDRLGKVIRAVA
jgi:adenosylmethionine-8-amino-7-oxononanoate aminotransferase